MLAAGLGLSGSGVALAQPSNLTIGFVDQQAVLSQAPQTNAVMQGLQQEFAPRAAEIDAMAVALQEQQQRLETDGPVMSEAELLALQREIREGGRDLERQQSIYLEDVELRQNEEMQVVSRRLSELIATWADDAGYDLLLRDAVFVNPRVDVTDDVLEFLTEEFGGAESD